MPSQESSPLLLSSCRPRDRDSLFWAPPQAELGADDTDVTSVERARQIGVSA